MWVIGRVPPKPEKSASLGFIKTTRNWPTSSAHNRAKAFDFSGSGGTAPHRKHEHPRFWQIELHLEKTWQFYRIATVVLEQAIAYPFSRMQQPTSSNIEFSTLKGSLLQPRPKAGFVMPLFLSLEAL